MKLSALEFERLARPHLDVAFRIAYAMLSDRDEAEDAVQEAVLRAWTKRDQISAGPDAFGSWFLAIVVNRCRMTRRSRWWRVLRVGHQPEERAAPAEADAVPAQLDLWQAVRRLRPEDRTVLVLHYGQDMSLQEVAAVLGISVAATKSRVHRALLKLRPAFTVEVQS
jgi:RNA polymerase sigma-70 factor (ECF subfamily)